MKINYETPIEEYKVGGKTVHIKRDDLQGDGIELPPWGKLAGIEKVLSEGGLDNSIPLVQLSIRASYSGWALAQLGKDAGFDVKIAYPNSKNYPQEKVTQWESYGAESVPLRANVNSIVLSWMKKKAEEEGWQYIPYGFDHPIYHEYWRNRVSEYDDYDNLVVCAGTPVTCLGMCQGFTGRNIYLPSTSKEKTVLRRLKKFGLENDERISVHQTEFDFYDTMDDYKTPFTLNRYWDKKAFWWLENNIENLEGETLFWSLGA
tara:strand:+ start:5252 stop:6034 length:783 start_codon:yes stop_codon:yes gene_type:complete